MKRTTIESLKRVSCVSAIVLASGTVFAEESFVKTSVASTTISGFVDTSAIINFGNNTVYGRTIDTTEVMDGFNFHMANLTLSSDPVGSGEFKAGYKVELLFGPAANKLGSTSILSNPGDDIAIKQAYVDLQAPLGEGNLNVQIGTWDKIVGYESFNSAANAQFSRSFAFFLEPLVHTGIKASYEIVEGIEIIGGIADSFRNVGRGGAAINGRAANNGDLTYMGALSLTLPEDGPLAGSNVYAGVAYGASVNASSQDILYYGGITIPVSDLISVGVANDYVDYEQFGGYANATSFYLSMAATDDLSFHNRFEYARSNRNVWASNSTLTGDEEFIGETFTIQYDLFDNVLTRLEARWDHALEGNPFNGSDDSVSLIGNVVYLF